MQLICPQQGRQHLCPRGLSPECFPLRTNIQAVHDTKSALNGNMRDRAAINMPIQGTSADMIKLAMIKIDELLRKKPYQTRMLLQVHDELVFDLHPDEESELVPKILHIMESTLPLPHDVPILVEKGTGENWLTAH
ncbi:MAG: DNA polymerase [Akkermansiaceae bacterium]